MVLNKVLRAPAELLSFAVAGNRDVGRRDESRGWNENAARAVREMEVLLHTGAFISAGGLDLSREFVKSLHERTYAAIWPSLIWKVKIPANNTYIISL
jgi:hypothetical protein